MNAVVFGGRNEIVLFKESALYSFDSCLFPIHVLYYLWKH